MNIFIIDSDKVKLKTSAASIQTALLFNPIMGETCKMDLHKNLAQMKICRQI